MHIIIQTMIMTRRDRGPPAHWLGGVSGRPSVLCGGEGSWCLVVVGQLTRSMKLIRAPVARWRFTSATKFIIFAQNCQAPSLGRNATLRTSSGSAFVIACSSGTRRGLGVKPPKMSFSPFTLKHTGQESGGDLCKIFKFCCRNL